jgi:putative Mn2+ efflux pump MntP
MTLAGVLAGENILKYIRGVDHWAAAGLLLCVGVRMGYESFRPPHEHKDDPSKGLALIVLAVATSLDALAVGLGLAALQVSIVYPAVVIGAVSFIMAVVGMKIAPGIGRLIGRWAELAGGLILVLIGVRILVTHLRS